MCSLCGVLGGQQHWTDAVGDAAVFPARQLRQTRRQERQFRVRLMNRILRHYGLRVADWDGQGYLLETFTGRSAMVDNLTQLWAEAEKLLGRPCDPLDDALLANLHGEAG